jgi:hypothetical protein
MYSIACFSISSIVKQDYAFPDAEVTVFGLTATLSLFGLLLVTEIFAFI